MTGHKRPVFSEHIIECAAWIFGGDAGAPIILIEVACALNKFVVLSK